MNKKFSTLVASFLLVGGLLNGAYADKFQNVTDEGQYYQVQLDDRTSFTANYMLLNENGSYVYPSAVTDVDATLWRVEILKQEVNGADKVIGYKLINKKTGKALSATDSNGKVYDTFDSEPIRCLWFQSGVLGYVNGQVLNTGVAGSGAWWYDLVKAAPTVYSAVNR